MKSRLPAFLSKDKICIICEGDEEYDYLIMLMAMEIFLQDIKIVIKMVHLK